MRNKIVPYFILLLFVYSSYCLAIPFTDLQKQILRTVNKFNVQEQQQVIVLYGLAACYLHGKDKEGFNPEKFIPRDLDFFVNPLFFEKTINYLRKNLCSEYSGFDLVPVPIPIPAHQEIKSYRLQDKRVVGGKPVFVADFSLPHEDIWGDFRFDDIKTVVGVILVLSIDSIVDHDKKSLMHSIETVNELLKKADDNHHLLAFGEERNKLHHLKRSINKYMDHMELDGCLKGGLHTEDSGGNIDPKLWSIRSKLFELNKNRNVTDHELVSYADAVKISKPHASGAQEVGRPKKQSVSHSCRSQRRPPPTKKHGIKQKGFQQAKKKIEENKFGKSSCTLSLFPEKEKTSETKKQNRFENRYAPLMALLPDSSESDSESADDSQHDLVPLNKSPLPLKKRQCGKDDAVHFDELLGGKNRETDQSINSLLDKKILLSGLALLAFTGVIWNGNIDDIIEPVVYGMYTAFWDMFELLEAGVRSILSGDPCWQLFIPASSLFFMYKYRMNHKVATACFALTSVHTACLLYDGSQMPNYYYFKECRLPLWLDSVSEVAIHSRVDFRTLRPISSWMRGVDGNFSVTAITKPSQLRCSDIEYLDNNLLKFHIKNIPKALRVCGFIPDRVINEQCYLHSDRMDVPLMYLSYLKALSGGDKLPKESSGSCKPVIYLDSEAQELERSLVPCCFNDQGSCEIPEGYQSIQDADTVDDMVLMVPSSGGQSFALERYDPELLSGGAWIKILSSSVQPGVSVSLSLFPATGIYRWTNENRDDVDSVFCCIKGQCYRD